MYVKKDGVSLRLFGSVITDTFLEANDSSSCLVDNTCCRISNRNVLFMPIGKSHALSEKKR